MTYRGLIAGRAIYSLQKLRVSHTRETARACRVVRFRARRIFHRPLVDSLTSRSATFISASPLLRVFYLPASSPRFIAETRGEVHDAKIGGKKAARCADGGRAKYRPFHWPNLSLLSSGRSLKRPAFRLFTSLRAA
jgi:hypothetical protein